LTNGYDNSAKSWNTHHHYNDPLIDKSTTTNTNKKYYDNYNNTSSNNSTNISTPLSSSKYNYLTRRDSSLDTKSNGKSVSSSNLSSVNVKPIDTTTSISGVNSSRSWYNNNDSTTTSNNSNKYLNKTYYNDNLNDTPTTIHNSTSSYLYDTNTGSSENAKRVLHKYAHRTSGAKTERLNCKASKSSPSLAYSTNDDNSLYSTNHDHDNVSSSKWHSTANTSSASAINPFVHSSQLSNTPTTTTTTTTNSNNYYHPSTTSTTYYPYYHHYSHYHLPTTATTTSSSTLNNNSYYNYPTSSSSYYNYPNSSTTTTTAPSVNLSSTREHKWNELDSMLGAQSALLNRLESDFVANRTKLKAAVNISSPLITSSSSNLSLTSTTANLPSTTTTTTSYSKPSNLTSVPDYPQSTADLLISKYASNRYIPSSTTLTAAPSVKVTSNNSNNNNDIDDIISLPQVQPIPENILESGKVRKVLKYTSGKTAKAISDNNNSGGDSGEISLKKYNYTEPLHEIIKELNLNSATTSSTANISNDIEDEILNIEENNNTNISSINNITINNIEPEISGIKYTNDDFVPQVLQVNNNKTYVYKQLKSFAVKTRR